MKQTSSSRKVNEAAREKIASILLMEVSDPRLDLITVTGTEVSLDRSLCKVYISTAKDRYEEVQAGLASANSRIRYLLGKGLNWRVTPELYFIIDTSVDEAERIAKALEVVPPTMANKRDDDADPVV